MASQNLKIQICAIYFTVTSKGVMKIYLLKLQYDSVVPCKKHEKCNSKSKSNSKNNS